MTIKLNGTMIEITAGETLAALLRRHDIAEDASGVAVAVNDAVVPKREWSARKLESGDTVEVIRAVQGG
jgi:sulfur carrier protein